jgi:hypothetical protein
MTRKYKHNSQKLQTQQKEAKLNPKGQKLSNDSKLSKPSKLIYHWAVFLFYNRSCNPVCFFVLNFIFDIFVREKVLAG